jgi:hypothetical protein
VFALCHLLGFRFAPRIPNIAARRLHLFNGIEPGPDIAPLVAGRIDEGLIEAHWDDVLRLGTSIRTGVVSASIMLERLGSYPRANGLALALREMASPQGLFARQRFLGHKRNMGYATRFNRAIGSLSGWNSPAGSRLACSQR